MSPLQTNWLPVILMILSGGVIGAALAWVSRRRAGAIAPAAVPLERRELLATRDSLIDRLREIEDTASKRTPEQLALILERYQIEVEAAVVLRAIKKETRKAASVSSEIADASAPRSGVVGFVGGVGFAGAIGALFFLVHLAANDRAPGTPMTGESGGAFPERVATEGAARDPGEHVGGVIALDPSAASQVHYPAIVFIAARPEGVTAGAPSAVLRLDVSSFPVAFSLGSENSMIGGKLPPRVRIEARIDPDGNVSTREPDARHGFIDRVPLGSNSLRIVVK